MDSVTVTSLKIPKIKLLQTIPMQLANGQYSTPITHKTIPLTLQLGDHFEKISFLITSIPHPILLGLPWLRLHAPNTDWKNLIFTFQQNCISRHHCKQECSIKATNTNYSSITSRMTLNTRIERSPIQNQSSSISRHHCKLECSIKATNTNSSSIKPRTTLNTRIKSLPIQNQSPSISRHHCKLECSIKATNTNFSPIESRMNFNTQIESISIQDQLPSAKDKTKSKIHVDTISARKMFNLVKKDKPNIYQYLINLNSKDPAISINSIQTTKEYAVSNNPLDIHGIPSKYSKYSNIYHKKSETQLQLPTHQENDLNFELDNKKPDILSQFSQFSNEISNQPNPSICQIFTKNEESNNLTLPSKALQLSLNSTTRTSDFEFFKKITSVTVTSYFNKKFLDKNLDTIYTYNSISKLLFYNNLLSLPLLSQQLQTLTIQTHFIPAHKKISTRETALLFIINIFKIHGMPISITSNCGFHFTSALWEQFLKIFECDRNLTSGCHPESNGSTEVTNKILEQYLNIHYNYKQNDWPPPLSVTEISNNNFLNTSTNKTPCSTNQGYNLIFSFRSFTISTLQIAGKHAKSININFERSNQTLKMLKTATPILPINTGKTKNSQLDKINLKKSNQTLNMLKITQPSFNKFIKPYSCLTNSNNLLHELHSHKPRAVETLTQSF